MKIHSFFSFHPEPTAEPSICNSIWATDLENSDT